jgi:hypothetical protein
MNGKAEAAKDQRDQEHEKYETHFSFLLRQQETAI